MLLGSYGSLRSLRVFLVVVFALPTAIGDAIPLPIRWPHSLYYLDDRALRRHTHSIPLQYIKLLFKLFISNTLALLIKTSFGTSLTYKFSTVLYNTPLAAQGFN